MHALRLPLVAAVLALASCGTEAGRVPFTGEGAGQKDVTLESKAVSLWTDIDIEYEGDAAATYTVELLQGGAVVGTATCDPLGAMSVKMGWVETNIGSSHSRSGSGKMACTITPPKGGATTVKATLAFTKKPAKLVLKKADLVVKQ